MKVSRGSQIYLLTGTHCAIFKRARNRHAAERWYFEHFKERVTAIRVTKEGRSILRELIIDECEINKTSQAYIATKHA